MVVILYLVIDLMLKIIKNYYIKITFKYIAENLFKYKRRTSSELKAKYKQEKLG